MTSYPIFVYGTLKSGHSRENLLRDQRYLGTAITEPNYKIYRYNSFPAMLDAEFEGKSIFGELYEVSESCLVKLDEVEGVREGLFYRKNVKLKHINFFRLPIYKLSSEMVIGNSAVAYFFGDKSINSSLKDCGQNWTITE